MSLLPEQTTFRRVQTDDPATLTSFFSIDGVDALGRPQPGPMKSITVPFTAEEAAAVAAIVARHRQLFCDQENAALNPAPEPTP